LEVNRSDMFIFGHNLSSANLMAIYHPDDMYDVKVSEKCVRFQF
jgi:hypothetical protein